MKKTVASTFTIEKARRIKDADYAAVLMDLAFDSFSQYLFGTEDKSKILSYFKKLWIHKNNRMSSKYSFVIRENETPIALLSSYRGSFVDKLFLRSLLAFLWIRRGYSFYLLTHLNYLYTVLVSAEAEKDEYYIFMLAVLPEYQNKGLGTKLLEFAEQEALNRRLKKCSLLVRTANKGAIRFYERHGYKKVKTYKRVPFDFYKMIKILSNDKRQFS